MKNLYRFSPIKTEEAFNKTLYYITEELEKFSEELFNEVLPIDTLKVFPHYPEEYTYLKKLVSKKGPKSKYSSETSYYVEYDKEITGHKIKYLGVRIVDPYRLHVGCGDYYVQDLSKIKSKFIGTTPYIRSFRQDMIEIWHPEFDVLGYVMQEE